MCIVKSATNKCELNWTSFEWIWWKLTILIPHFSVWNNFSLFLTQSYRMHELYRPHLWTFYLFHKVFVVLGVWQTEREQIDILQNISSLCFTGHDGELHFHSVPYGDGKCNSKACSPPSLTHWETMGRITARASLRHALVRCFRFAAGWEEDRPTHTFCKLY